MHGLPRALVEKQAQALELPIRWMELPPNTTMESYDRILKNTVEQLKLQGCMAAAFGDIFLEDLRAYRENQLQRVGVEALFPLWQQDTRSLVQKFVDQGFEALVVCLDERKLPQEFLGRKIDADFLKDLPTGVDPCGENGEFHTFCYQGPIFKHPIEFTIGTPVRKTYPDPENSSNEIGYWFLDLNPAQ